MASSACCVSPINGSLATASLRRNSLLPSTTTNLTQSLSSAGEFKRLSLVVSRRELKQHNRASVFVPRAELSTEELQSLDAPAEDDEAGIDSESDFEPSPPAEESKLYVGNLPWSCTAAELAEVFGKIGSVEMAEVIYDRDSGRSRGFGFVTMSSTEDANAAIEKLDGSDYDGRAIRVNYPNRGRAAPSGLPPRARYNDNTNKLFVGNLAWGVDDALLQDLFSEFGKVLEARVVMDRDTGRSRGFGFVTMSSEEEVNEALNKMDGAEVEGRSLKVNMAGERPSARGGLY